MATTTDLDLTEVADFHRSMGATEVYVFGSAVRGTLKDSSDLDIAVQGLPDAVFFSAASKAWDIADRPVDLVSLEDDSAKIRYLLRSGELVRVE